MREVFERNIYDYRDLAVSSLLQETEEKKENNDLQHARALEYVLNWHLERAARTRDTSIKAQRDIYEIQKKKQMVMEELHRKLRALDHDTSDEEREKIGVPVTYKEDTLFTERNDIQEPLTLGALFTDGVWGIQYTCDATVPRDIRKRSIVEEAKRALRALLDEQIARDEGGSKKTDYGKKEAYAHAMKEGKEGIEHPGLIAEKMVEQFFTKLSFDGLVSFEVLPADLYQDVEQKVDFILHRKARVRGVGITTEKDATFGVQFTTNTSSENLYKKARQIERAKEHFEEKNDVQDIVLVSIPLNDIFAPYEEWQKTKTPGGPDVLWSSELKETLFRKTLTGFLSDDEINEEWKKVCGIF